MSDVAGQAVAEAADLASKADDFAKHHLSGKLWDFYRAGVRPAAAWVCTFGLFVELVVLRIAAICGRPVQPLDLGALGCLVVPLVVHQVSRSFEKQAGCG